MSIRRQIDGAPAIARALARGEPLGRIILRDEAATEGLAMLERSAREAGVPVQRVSARHFQRLQRERGTDALALLGPAPPRGAEDVLRGAGATWHLFGVRYPGNVGAVLRTAEVSGASGAFVEADFDHTARRTALRNSMRVDRFLPVFFGSGSPVLADAARHGRRIVAIEDSGERAPWDVDLTGRVHLVVGGEAEGIPTAVLAASDVVVRIPVAGFVPSYNVQAAVAAVAAERLRQLAGASR